MDQKNDRSDEARANTAFTMRIILAGYLLYLGVDVIRDHLLGRSTLSAPIAWVSGVLFIAAAVIYGHYIWRDRQARSGWTKGTAAPDDTSGDDQT